MKLIQNNRGSSLIGSLFLVLIMGLAGGAAVNMSTGERANSLNELQATQAFYISQAGLEISNKLAADGIDPNGLAMNFGQGSFNVAYNGTAATSVGNVGNATKSQTVAVNVNSGPKAGECMAIDTNNARLRANGNHLVGLRVISSCEQAKVVTSMEVDWRNDYVNNGNSVWDASSLQTRCNLSNATETMCSDQPHDVKFMQGTKTLACIFNTSDSHNITKQTVLMDDPNDWYNIYGHSNTTAFNSRDYLGPCEGDGSITCMQKYEAISVCDDDDHSIHAHVGGFLKKVYFDGTLLNVPLANTLPDQSITTNFSIDAGDTVYFENAARTLGLEFEQEQNNPWWAGHPFPGWSTQNNNNYWFKVTLNYSDGSTNSKSFMLTASQD